jgi:C_GCAxxG_C_C family probable redox protein
MKRREFLSGCALGLPVAAGCLATCDTACGAEKSAKRKIDAKKFVETTHRHFIPGKLTCCEAILMTGCDALGIKSKLVPDIALGLAGGIGLQGDTCGVLTASAMVLSLAVARKETEYPKKKKATLAAVGRLYRDFKKQCGHTDCRTLSGLDLTTPEGREKLKQGVKATKCDKCVRAGAALLAKELNRL